MRDQTSGINRLREWQATLEPPTQARVAQMIGRSEALISGILKGNERVGIGTADAIEEASHGFVRVELWGFAPTEQQLSVRKTIAA